MAQRGFSLIELMIALLISSILVLGMVQVFAASRNAYRLSEGVSRAQENSRFAMDFLQRDLRMAGHFGCINDRVRLQSAGRLVSHFATGGVLDFANSIRGYDNEAPLGLTLIPERVAGTDTLVLRFLGSTGVPVTRIDRSNLSMSVVEVDPAKWSRLSEEGDGASALFGVADCVFADVFSAQKVSARNGQLAAPASVDLERYGVGLQGGLAQLYRAHAWVYYIGVGTSGQRALFRARIGVDGRARGEELVEGIEDLQFRYGMDSSVAGDSSGTIAFQGRAVDVGSTDLAWRRVSQVQMGFIAASPMSANALQVRSLDVLGHSVTPAGDGRFRAVYVNTIALRNRLHGN